MRAAVMRQGRLLVDQVPDPVPTSGEVLVRTLACGICGSDLHALRDLDRLTAPGARTASFAAQLQPGRDLVMGHEFCAEIVAHGPDCVGTLAVGTRVCSVPMTTAPDPATVGYSHTHPGGFGELMRLSEHLLLPVPEDLPTEVAALTEPLSVGRHAVEKAGVRPGDLPLVIGCGPIGLAVVAALVHRGIGPVLAADFSPTRRRLAEALGADEVIDPAVSSPYARWQDVARTPAPSAAGADLTAAGRPRRRPGVIFECVGVPGVLNAIFEGAARGTRVVVAGVCMEGDRIEPMVAIDKELSVQFVLGYSAHEFADTLRALATGELAAGPLITDRVGLDGVAAAFAELRDPEAQAKVVVEPWR